MRAELMKHRRETNGGTTPDPSTIQEELQGSSEDYYVVQKGDTLDLISKSSMGQLQKRMQSAG